MAKLPKSFLAINVDSDLQIALSLPLAQHKRIIKSPRMSGLRTTLPRALRELRIHLCQSSSESEATRSFVSKVFPEVKKHNPTLPILIREAADVPPRAIARGERGLERSTDLRGASDHSEVESRIAQLVQEIAR